jgi:sugar phosphate permease
MNMQGRTLATWRGRIFLAAWMLYAGYYICRKDVGTTANGAISHLALVLACFGAAYALGQLVGGTLADRVGPRRTALAGAGISICCTVLLAWCSQPVLGVLLQLGNGFGQGFGWPSLLKLIGSWFRRNERDRVLGWWSTSYILGGLLATSLTAWLLVHTGFAARAGIHSAYLVSSFILLGTALFFYRETVEPPHPVFDSKPSAEFAPQAEGSPWMRVLKNRNIRILSGMYFFLKMTRYTLLFWLPLYLTSGLGYATYRAEHTASYFELCGFLGPVAVGYASERWFRERRLTLATGMLFLLAFICLLHPMLTDSGWFGLIVSISLMGILIHGADMLVSGMAVLDAVPGELHGRAVGFVNAIGSIGQLLSPLLVTFFVSRLGWTKLFDLFVFFALVSGAICAFAMRPKTHDTSPSNRSVLETSNLPL